MDQLRRMRIGQGTLFGSRQAGRMPAVRTRKSDDMFFSECKDKQVYATFGWIYRYPIDPQKST